jgi:uncharacterized protein YecT (DUF1311 family)
MGRLSVLAFVFIVGSAVAQDRADCSEAISQLEMNKCAAKDFILADKELNRVYNAILLKESEDNGFIAKLRAAQRAWVAFRDAQLEAAFYCKEASGGWDPCFGSMASMSYSSLKAKMTRERIDQLKDMMRERGCPGCG